MGLRCFWICADYGTTLIMADSVGNVLRWLNGFNFGEILEDLLRWNGRHFEMANFEIFLPILKMTHFELVSMT